MRVVLEAGIEACFLKDDKFSLPVFNISNEIIFTRRRQDGVINKISISTIHHNEMIT